MYHVIFIFNQNGTRQEAESSTSARMDVAATCAMGLDIDIPGDPRRHIRLFITSIVDLEDSEYEEEIRPECR